MESIVNQIKSLLGKIVLEKKGKLQEVSGAMEKKINRLMIYLLYNFTEEEIETVKGGE
jgi:hypothetical protein